MGMSDEVFFIRQHLDGMRELVVYMDLHRYIHVYTCIHQIWYAHIYIYIHTHTHTHKYTHIHMYIYMSESRMGRGNMS